MADNFKKFRTMSALLPFFTAAPRFLEVISAQAARLGEEKAVLCGHAAVSLTNFYALTTNARRHNGMPFSVQDRLMDSQIHFLVHALCIDQQDLSNAVCSLDSDLKQLKAES